MRQYFLDKKLQSQTVYREKLSITLSFEKVARKMLIKLTPDEESDDVVALFFKEGKTSGAEEDLHYNLEEFNYDQAYISAFLYHFGINAYLSDIK